MRSGKNLKRLLKIAQENNTADWQAVKAEVESEELPPGIVDVAVIEESNRDMTELMEKAQEAKSSVSSMSEENKKDLAEAWVDKDFWDMANKASGGKISTSGLIDALFIKKASKYISKNDAALIIREINLYNSLNNLDIKIASKNKQIREVLLKEAAFNNLLNDAILNNNSALLKTANKYSKGLIKNAEESLWESAKNLGSKVLDAAGSGLKYVGKAIKYTFKFIFTVLPFIGVFLSAKEAYHSYENVKRSMEVATEKYSDLGNSDVIFNPDYIKKLISKYENDPKTLLRVAQVNKIAKFYKKSWLDGIYSVLWFVSDLVMSIGVVATVIGTGGAAAAIEAPLAAMAKEVFGKGAVKWAERAGLGSIAGSILTSYFGVGVGDFDSNSAVISGIAERNIENAANTPATGITEVDSPDAGEEISDEEALRTFYELGKRMNRGS